MLVIEVKGGDLIEAIENRCAAADVKHAAVVSLIGAVDNFTISTMPFKADEDVESTYNVPAEMSGTGEIVDGRAHLHVVMAVEVGRAICGHLIDAYVRTHFARVYVLPL